MTERGTVDPVLVGCFENRVRHTEPHVPIVDLQRASARKHSFGHRQILSHFRSPHSSAALAAFLSGEPSVIGLQAGPAMEAKSQGT